MIPHIPAGAWPFGTLAEQSHGGLFAAIFADTVLPWTKNPAWDDPPGEDETPGWWDPPIPAYDRGEFEGWERNMAFEGGAKNFPEDRALNVALPLMRGFCNSDFAPYRQVGGGAFDWRWPHASTSQTTAFPTASTMMLYYLANHLEPGTRIIIPIPERDIMNFFGAPSMEPLPDPLLEETPPGAPVAIVEIGEDAIRTYILDVLTALRDAGGLDYHIGWYSLDEPDLGRRRDWASPAKLAKLRQLIHEAELEVRIAIEPGFASLSLDEQLARLRPVCLTLSPAFDEKDNFGNLMNLSVQPRLYKDAGAADIYFFDLYPFHRTLEALGPSIEECPFLKEKLHTFYAPNDPPRAIRMFRELRTQINGKLSPGQEGYIPVVHWQQSAGAPFRDAEIEPSSETEAADPPATLVGAEECLTFKSPTFQRIKKMPALWQFRYLAWASILEQAGALPFFNQPGIADDLVLSAMDPVIREIGFFRQMRSRFRNRFSELRFGTSGPPSSGNPLLPPVPAPPPVPAGSQASTELTHLKPTILFGDFLPLPRLAHEFDGPGVTWFIIINHTSITIGGQSSYPLPLRFTELPAAVGGQPKCAWEEMEWRDGALRPVLKNGIPVRLPLDENRQITNLTLGAWRVRLFRLINF